MSLLDLRADFFDFGGVTYLNCAYQGPLPRVAVEAAQEALDLKTTPHRILEEHYFSVPDAYRRAIGELIGADGRFVTVADSTTHGILLLVRGLDWRPGDEVVLARGEFPANRFPWLTLEKRGVRVREVEVGPGEAGVEAVAAAFGERTRVVSLAWIGYQTGERRDLAGLGALCRERGALFVVDASQGIGGLAFDLRRTPCDLLACSGYKWLLGPYGTGFAWVSPELTERLDTGGLNWFALRGARDFSRLDRCELELEPGARRFDVNETANFTNLAAATASVRYLCELTPARAERHVRALQDRISADLPAGFRPRAEPDAAERSNVFCLEGESAELVELAHRHLEELGVVVSRREGSLRISPFVYNVEADVERLLEGLHRAAGRPAVSAGAAAPPLGETLPTALLTPAELPAREPLEGPSIRLLRLLPERDAGDLFAASHGDPQREAVWTYLPAGPFADEPTMLSWLIGRAGEGGLIDLAVVDRSSSKAIGMAAFMRLRPEMRSLELGHIWYAPSHQRGRANTETIYLMLREAFDRLGYRRVEWKCDSLNRRSRAAALRLGFRFEGVFRQDLIVKGRNRDTAWYAMLDRDWPAVRRNLETWLAAEPGTVSLTALNRRFP